MLQNFTLSEQAKYKNLTVQMVTYWTPFLNQTFPGFFGTSHEITLMKGMELLSVYSMANPDAFVRTNIQWYDPLSNDTLYDIWNAFLNPRFEWTRWTTKTDFQSSLNSPFANSVDPLMSVVWYTRLPCFDTYGISSEEQMESSFLKRCIWKGEVIPCSAIFKSIPTDRGMCCSFNIQDAEDFFVQSQYQKMISKLQNEDLNNSFLPNTLPDWYTENGEPTTMPGVTMGLTIIVDAHTDQLEAYSIDSDFQGYTALVTNHGEFPLTYLKGFDVRPGHRNLIALSATKIDADDDIRDIPVSKRKCKFSDEVEDIKFFESYSQANCYFECKLEEAQKEELPNQFYPDLLTKKCTPWFFPNVENETRTCDPWDTAELLKIMAGKSQADKCNECMPDCRHIIYSHSVTAQPFRNCDEKNFGVSDFCNPEMTYDIAPQNWVASSPFSVSELEYFDPKNYQSSKRYLGGSSNRPDVFPNLPKEYEAFEKDIAIVTVFFDTPTVLQFTTQSSQGWIDYFANVGGLLGLCIGLSMVTLIELAWLCLRVVNLVRKRTGINCNPKSTRY